MVQKKSQDVNEEAAGEMSAEQQWAQDILGTSVPIDQVKEVLSESGLDTQVEPDEDAILREEKDVVNLKKEKPTSSLGKVVLERLFS